jgi:hypothetical protein
VRGALVLYVGAGRVVGKRPRRSARRPALLINALESVRPSPDKYQREMLLMPALAYPTAKSPRKAFARMASTLRSIMSDASWTRRFCDDDLWGGRCAVGLHAESDDLGEAGAECGRPASSFSTEWMRLR